ncbi:hypothetical protein QBC33DRAFT_547148 [Phialemonium atrogriseum]|uniref:Uncharacterized protein n=1 Tax=Phialemonium atrogriseum TaxID=1093897 RepID=A0AAJ0FEJ1_9PEZI|nr:uncharacterized protein QBC33DRAFT_547148 [Phialemonium atrogriseum]KAK1764412.1 hypothetical protein QBC33DRAFT_547148 [Phialemonium atrogriseum]
MHTPTSRLVIANTLLAGIANRRRSCGPFRSASAAFVSPYPAQGADATVGWLLHHLDPPIMTRPADSDTEEDVEQTFAGSSFSPTLPKPYAIAPGPQYACRSAYLCLPCGSERFSRSTSQYVDERPWFPQGLRCVGSTHKNNYGAKLLRKPTSSFLFVVSHPQHLSSLAEAAISASSPLVRPGCIRTGVLTLMVHIHPAIANQLLPLFA